MASYLKLGKIVSAHGLKGEIVLTHHLGKPADLKKVEVLYVEEKKDNLLPYFIQQAKKKSATEILVLLEGVDTREKAQQLVTRAVWLPQEQFERLASPTAPASLLGFQVIDHQNVLGEIIEVIEQPQQLLCKVIIQNKEVLIPINEDTLIEIDQAARHVMVQLPEGLLDIYLS
jgi:16S rRNA processing protein RimM